MKKIYLSFITIFAMFFCVMSAKAWEPAYTAYKAGDEIEVVLGKGIKAKFFVIEDSDSENWKLTAIYKDVLGEAFYFGPTKASIAGSTAKTKLDELTKDWETPNEIRLIDVSEINDEIDTSSEEDYEFTKPTFLNIGKSYWTETVINSNDTFKPYVVNGSSAVSTLKTTADSTAYIRPVIEIEKGYVQGGVAKPKNWEELSDAYYSYFLKVSEEYIKETNMIVTKTNNMLHFKWKYDNEDYELKINYEDGIIKARSGLSEDGKLLEYFIDYYIEELIIGKVEYDGYVMTQELGWFKSETSNGMLKVEKRVSENIFTVEIDMKYYLGWKTEEEEKAEEIPKDETKEETTTSKKEETKDEQKVENTKKEEAEKNPKTADTNVILVMLGLIASGSLIVISKKKLCKK